MSDRRTIPGGVCQCGCGERTAVPLKSNARRGHVAGVPYLYKRGHARRVSRPQRSPERINGRYKMTVVDGHPYAYTTEAGTSYVYSHRLAVEEAIGHPLHPRHPVHHVNNDGLDNSNRNLVACEDQAYHVLLHARADARADGLLRCRDRGGARDGRKAPPGPWHRHAHHGSEDRRDGPSGLRAEAPTRDRGRMTHLCPPGGQIGRDTLHHGGAACGTRGWGNRGERPKRSSLRGGRFASAEFESRPPHCRETGHIRSAIGCDGVGPRHRAGLGVQRALEGTLPWGTRRPGRLVRGGETVTRCAHNAEIPGSIPGPAIDRFDITAERDVSTTACRLGHLTRTIRTPNVARPRSARYRPEAVRPSTTTIEGGV